MKYRHPLTDPHCKTPWRSQSLQVCIYVETSMHSLVRWLMWPKIWGIVCEQGLSSALVWSTKSFNLTDKWQRTQQSKQVRFIGPGYWLVGKRETAVTMFQRVSTCTWCPHEISTHIWFWRCWQDPCMANLLPSTSKKDFLWSFRQHASASRWLWGLPASTTFHGSTSSTLLEVAETLILTL